MKATRLIALAGAATAVGLSFGAHAQCDPVPGALIGGGIGAAIGNAPGAAVGAIIGSAITAGGPCYYGPRYAEAPAPRYERGYYDRGYYPAPAPAPSGYVERYYEPAPAYYAPPPVYYRSYPAYAYAPAVVVSYGGYRYYRHHRHWR